MRNLVARPRPLIPPTRHLPDGTSDNDASSPADDDTATPDDTAADACFGVRIRRLYLFQQIWWLSTESLRQ